MFYNTTKYSKHLDDPMTRKELEIWHSQEIEISQSKLNKGKPGKTYKETKKELHVTESTIANTKKKPEYNALSQAMYEELHYGVRQAAKDMIALTKATKGVNVRVPAKAGGSAMVIERIQEPDNVTRFNAVSDIGDVFGIKAPKQVDLKHSMAAMSDEEIQKEIDDSVKEIEQNANIRRTVAGSQDAGTIISSTIASAKTGVEIGSDKSEICPTDS